MNRRTALLAASGVGAAALLVGEPDRAMATSVDFYGQHQAGIVTPAQDRLHFVAFDVVTADRAKFVQLMKDWTVAAAHMTSGRSEGATGGPAEAPPSDTGEALGLSPSQLTLTVGFGPSLFSRFGLGASKPAALQDLPHFPGDAIQPEISGGDVCIQSCAHDPQVAVHAIRNLARIGFGVVSVRYAQLGFISRGQTTPRNLLGFKDGTHNLKQEKQLWAQPGDGPQWMNGGSYLVTRRIRMMIETWDRTSLGEQETIIGRTKGEGAPIGLAREFDETDLSKLDDRAHVKLAHPGSNGDVHLLRRGYNFVDGSDGLGRLDAGLFFMAYQRDPRQQFVVVQRNLARADRLNEYIRHTSSGLWAVPPGVSGPGDYWGSALLS